MDRAERCEKKFAELFGGKPTVNESSDPGFMRILQRFIFGEVSYAGSLDDRMRELITVTVLVVNQTLPQLKAHVGASLNVGCTPEEIREAVYQCAPFVGFPKTLNAIAAMNEVFSERGISLPLPDAATVTEEDRIEKGLALQEALYGTEIKDRYAWLPGEFAEAVPRWLTELCFSDFMTRNGRGGGSGALPCRGRIEGGEHRGRDSLRARPRHAVYGRPPPLQRVERLSGCLAECVKIASFGLRGRAICDIISRKV